MNTLDNSHLSSKIPLTVQSETQKRLVPPKKLREYKSLINTDDIYKLREFSDKNQKPNPLLAWGLSLWKEKMKCFEQPSVIYYITNQYCIIVIKM